MNTVTEIAARVHEIGADKIDAKTLETLRDMCRRANQYGGRLTERQADYAASLLNRAEAAKAAPAAQAVDLSRINVMFEKAAQHKKSPKVYFLAGQAEFSVAPAKAGSKNPGFLYVKQGSTYLGKIGPDGLFSHSRDALQMASSVYAALRAFASDPAAAASAYGRETSRCCFCAKKLEHPVSVAVGFGPDCADNHGLDWSMPAGEVA